MNEDNRILLSFFIFYFFILLIFVFRCKKRVKTFLINFILILLYGGIMAFEYLNSTHGEVAFVWYCYLLILIGIHTLLNFVGLFISFYKPQKQCL